MASFFICASFKVFLILHSNYFWHNFRGVFPSKLGTLMNIYKPHYIYRENDYGISSSNEKKQKLQKRKIQKEAVKQIDTLVQDNLNLKKYYMLDDNLNVLNRIFNNYKDILDKHKNVLNQNKFRVCNNIIRSLRLVLFAIKLKRQLAS